MGKEYHTRGGWFDIPAGAVCKFRWTRCWSSSCRMTAFAWIFSNFFCTILAVCGGSVWSSAEVEAAASLYGRFQAPCRQYGWKGVSNDISFFLVLFSHQFCSWGEIFFQNGVSSKDRGRIVGEWSQCAVRNSHCTEHFFSPNDSGLLRLTTLDWFFPPPFVF